MSELDYTSCFEPPEAEWAPAFGDYDGDSQFPTPRQRELGIDRVVRPHNLPEPGSLKYLWDGLIAEGSQEQD